MYNYMYTWSLVKEAKANLMKNTRGCFGAYSGLSGLVGVS